MNKPEHIAYWKTTAARDWKFVQQILKTKNYAYALFFAHLVLEKLCKAHWIKDNKSNNPPRIHNLVHLAEATKLKISSEDLDFLRKMNTFQLEGRYPDYKQEIFRTYRQQNTALIIKKVNQLRQWLLKELH
jgi:HEPN domain-containing protein